MSSGRTVGGHPLTNGPLAHILKNRTYLGEINHRGNSYPGEHEPIIAVDQFAAVQALIATNNIERRRLRVRSAALLTGKLRDDRDHVMSPSYAVKNGARYRYYVSQASLQGRKAEAGSLPRVAADAIEQAVIEQLRAFVAAADGGERQQVGTHDPEPDAALIQRLVNHVALGKSEIVIHLDTEGLTANQPGTITFAWTPPSAVRRREIIEVAAANDAKAAMPMSEETRSKLIRAIAQARLWLVELMRTDSVTTEAIASREGMSERAVRMRLSLAFLAPDIVEAAIAGRLPQSFGITRLSDLPSDWAEQRKVLGIAIDAR
jgi:hypothetical protein